MPAAAPAVFSAPLAVVKPSILKEQLRKDARQRNYDLMRNLLTEVPTSGHADAQPMPHPKAMTAMAAGRLNRKRPR
jgi:hypothetical protein